MNAEIANNLNIPVPSIARLCGLYSVLTELEQAERLRISSTELSVLLGVAAHNIRKDISYIGEIGDFGAGYEIGKLKSHISRKLNLGKERNACVVGLGRLGSAFVSSNNYLQAGIRIVAGFDTNVNKLEMLQTAVELYPAHEMAPVIKRKHIELAILAVPGRSAHEVAGRLIEAGVRGIVNFSSAPLAVQRPDVYIRNIDAASELRIISSMLSLSPSRGADDDQTL